MVRKKLTKSEKNAKKGKNKKKEAENNSGYIETKIISEDGKEKKISLYKSEVSTDLALPFRTDKGKPEFTVSFNPKMIISQEALSKQQTLVSIAGHEISWFGAVEKVKSDVFRLYDIFLPEQRVSGGETDASGKGINRIVTDLLKNMTPKANAIKIIRELRFWGHSHVNMGVEPSSQDNAQMKTFGQGGKLAPSYMFRGIFNKNGKVIIDMWHYKKGIIIKNLNWVPEAVVMDNDPLIQEYLEKVQVFKTHTNSSDRRSVRLSTDTGVGAADVAWWESQYGTQDQFEFGIVDRS